MMYDEMLTLICQAIEICVLSTEEACCPFLISFLVLCELSLHNVTKYPQLASGFVLLLASAPTTVQEENRQWN